MPLEVDGEIFWRPGLRAQMQEALQRSAVRPDGFVWKLVSSLKGETWRVGGEGIVSS